MGVLGLAGLITGCVGAALAARWHAASSRPLDFTFAINAGSCQGAAGYVAFVGLATFLYSGLFFPLAATKIHMLNDGSLPWLVTSVVICFLWLTAAAALSGTQGALSCGGADYYGIPCATGNCVLAFAWIGWVLAAANVFTAGLWFWKREDHLMAARHRAARAAAGGGGRLPRASEQNSRMAQAKRQQESSAPFPDMRAADRVGGISRPQIQRTGTFDEMEQ